MSGSAGVGGGTELREEESAFLHTRLSDFRGPFFIAVSDGSFKMGFENVYSVSLWCFISFLLLFLWYNVIDGSWQSGRLVPDMPGYL